MSEQRLDVTVARRVAYVPKSARFYRELEKLIGLIPTHRDTRSGRRNASQVRLVLLGTGILTVVLWESPWAPLALILCVLAFVVPLPESKRRDWTSKLRAKRSKQTRIERSTGELVVTEKHIELLSGEERLRRVRRQQAEPSDEDGVRWYREGKKKAGALALAVGRAEPELDAWAEGVDLDALDEMLQ